MSGTHSGTDRAASWVRPPQVQRLRTACYDDQFRPRFRQRNEAVVTLLYDSGLRVGELVRLDVEHLDLDSGDLRIPHAERGDTERSTPPEMETVSVDAAHSLGTVRLLKSYLYNRDVETAVLFPSREGDRLTPKAVRDVVAKAAGLATIRPYTPTGQTDERDVSPQTLRHGTAWRLLNVEERSMAAVQDRLRHTARSTTDSLYAHFEPGVDPSDESAAATVDGLDDQGDVPEMVAGVLESIPDILYVFDTNGRLLWWNDRVPAETGYTDAEIAAMHPLEFVPDEDTPDLAEAIARVVERGDIETMESHLVTESETRIPYEFNGAPLTDEAGTVWGVVGAGRDITARKRAAREAEREQERFDLFVDAVTDYAMFLLDPDGHIVSWNQGAERIKGYREAEVLGEHFSILYMDDDVEAGVPERLLDEAIAEGSVQDEGWRVRRDGTTFWAHVTITALYDEGELRGFAKVTRDMTEQREHEREIERQRDELERLNRINTVIRDVDRALVQASSRAEIEQAVCDRFNAVDSYTAAWFTDSRSTDRDQAPRAFAGLSEEDLAAIRAVAHDRESSDWPPLLARSTREVQVRRTHLDESTTDWDRLDVEGRSVTLAIPILHQETLYGVLVVYADGSVTVGERQQDVLAELGETIGYAIAATERKAALTADSVLELTFGIRDPDRFFVQASAQLGASLTLDGIAERGDDSYLEYVTVIGASPSAILDLADRLEALDHARVIHQYEDECLCEIGVTDSSLPTTVAEFGGTLTDMTAQNGKGSVRIELPRSAEVSHVVDALRGTVAEVDLRAKRTIDRPIRTEHRFRSALDDRLTDKQREALDAAYLAGFFEQPRLSTGEEIADSLDVSPSTFHQHVRVGLEKLLTIVAERPQENVRDE